MKYFEDRCVLLTGGSSGIGLAAARLLRGSGAHLILVARDEAKLGRTKEELEQHAGGELHVLPLDVGDLQAVEAAAESLPTSRPVDVLINNAGITRPGHFLELPPGTFEEMLKVNYLGAVYLTRLLLPGMVERKQGHVAYVSSLLGLMGVWGYTAYAASKFAVRGFAECLRGELRPHNIRVTVCYPPDTDTPQHEGEKPYLPPETRAIAATAGLLSAERVAQDLLHGMASGRFHIVPGASAKFSDGMNRLFPALVRFVLDWTARRA